MLRAAVRTLLAETGGRAPSSDGWALLLMAAGVESTKATTIPGRLGLVFHLGRYDEQDVLAQLDAWAAGLRVRAEPDVAQVVEDAAARLREDLERDPPPPPGSTRPDAPAPPPVAAPPPAPEPPQPPPSRRETRAAARAAEQQGRGQQGRQRGQQQRPPQGRQQRPPQQRGPQQLPPGGPQPHPQLQNQPPAAGQPPVRTAPPRATGQASTRPSRWVLVVGVVGTVALLSCCLVGLVADLLGGGS